MNRRTVATIILVASTIFGGVTGINKSYAERMTSCWNRFGQQIDILAQRHQVPQSLILAVIFHESGCSVDAVRFEPGVYRWRTVIQMAGGDEAERRFLSSSFGVMQVLGVTARGMGYDGTPTEFKMRSLEYGVRYLSIKHKKWGSWDNALRSFNGGDGGVLKHKRGKPNPRVELYVRSVQVLQEKYGKPIVREWLRQAKELA